MTYAPIKFQGIGLHNIYITMELLCIEMIMRECYSDSMTGSLIKTSIKAAKLELGLGTSLFQMEYSIFGKLLMKVGSFTLGASCRNLISLCLADQTLTLILRHIGDSFLIERFQQQGLKGKELACLNHCHLFLWVTMLSDISTTDGKQIHHAQHLAWLAGSSLPSYLLFLA